MAVAKSAKELFDTDLPDALAKHPEEAKEVNAVYCFKISGDEGGDWTVDLTADPPTCSTGDDGDAQCVIEVSDDDFKTMLIDAQAGMQLYLKGRLQVTGDPNLAAKLTQLFELAAKEA